jgi:phosphate starvation-inducible PhoH-like protein
MNFLFLFIFLSFSNGFLFPGHHLRRAFPLDLKRKDSNREIQLYEEREKEKQNNIYLPKTLNQQKYVEYMKNRNVSVVFGVGPAGSGKTLFACSSAIQELKQGYVDRIIITRPIFSVDEELGFLPGSIEQKMNPWTRPIFDIFSEFLSLSEMKYMVDNGVIEISPLAFMRGRTFKRCFIIADEMQNSSPKQMKMLLTRLGDDSRMVITGDLKQSDRSNDNGLYDFINRLRIFESSSDSSIQYVELNDNDIQRSAVVSNILKIYDGNVKKTIDINNSMDEKPHILRNIIPIVNNDCNVSRDHNNSNVHLNNDAAMIPRSYYPNGYPKNFFDIGF